MKPATARSTRTRSPAKAKVSAVVVAVSGREVVLRSEHGVSTARRAKGCLLAPEVGDVVVLLRGESGQGWVTDVLERASDGPAILDTVGETTLSTRGRLTLDASRGVTLATEGEAAVAAARFSLEAGEGRLHLERLTAVGEAFDAHAGEMFVAAQTSDTVAERLMARFGQAVRRVLGVDRLRAWSSDASAGDTANLRGGAMSVRAEGTVTANGGPIQFG